MNDIKTVGDLIKSEEPPPPATRAALAKKFAKLTEAFSLLIDGMYSVNEILSECRAMLDADGDTVEPEDADADDDDPDGESSA